MSTIRAGEYGERDMSSASTVTVKTLEIVAEAFNNHDIDAIMELFAEDCVMNLPRGTGPGGVLCRGKTEVREGIAARFDGLPDAHYGDERHWVVGNFGFSEWTLSGTQHNGELLEVQGCDHFEFSYGKITVKNSFWKIISNEVG
jgi:ketosteroid isomerase-like protein